MKIGSVEVHPIQNCMTWFDGGASFGHVPKVVWQKIVEPDAFNRVPVACNSLLIRMNGRTILTDVGMGEKWNEKERGLYGLETKSWDDLLKPFGAAPEDVDLILLSHLHIDHAGGLTRWDGGGRVVLTFPNARVIVQKGEWEAANNPDPRSRPSYRPHDYLPVLDAGRLDFIEGDTEVFPGCEFIVTGGHTAWHQILKITADDTKVVYTADILPTSAHLKPHWVMGYDLFPLGVMEARRNLLPELMQPSVYTAFGHDPRRILVKLEAGPKGEAVVTTALDKR